MVAELSFPFYGYIGEMEYWSYCLIFSSCIGKRSSRDIKSILDQDVLALTVVSFVVAAISDLQFYLRQLEGKH
ncbi:hypothetical protein L3X38_033916 [Prunus dulcis]|uniref:Uncharacterized protein n=1 Tax=Prunus dulcis TaxID=3755 RepID=A0AAD4VH53_PRUDU|nr:hypothetical protein L3X38_033916 [Prunus dulcis]